MPLHQIDQIPVLNHDPVDSNRRFQSLGEYLVSLAKIKSIAPTILKGGHGDDVAAPAGPVATEPLIVHIPDPRTGEIYLMMGTREVVRTDPALVARLVRDAG